MTKSTKTQKSTKTLISANETPAGRHAFLKAQAENKLNAIASYLADHGTTGPVDFGHVGDLGHVNEILQQALDFLSSTN
jgi:hypothetical protein